MSNRLLIRIRAGLQKARIESQNVRHSFADFAYDSKVTTLGNQVPVFCFHAVRSQEFESFVRFLANNHYHTLTGRQLHGFLTGTEPIADNAVVLTFDDGWRSTWSIAYPLMKKYGLTGICFLVPIWMQSETTSLGLTLEDSWTGKATRQEVESLEESSPYISWEEARTMQDSGVFEFQSHSLTHDTVFTSDQLVDFVNPTFHRVPHKIPIVDGIPENPFERSSSLGMPLYSVAPRLTGARRYIDDATVRANCISFVTANGGESFFECQEWRAKLTDYFQSQSCKRNGRTQTNDERDAAIRRELADSKSIIEERLGNVVNQLCFPFYAGSMQTAKISAECGYTANYWGWAPASHARDSFFGRDHSYGALDNTDLATGDALTGRRANRKGDDPFRIVRLPGDYIMRLPGVGRLSLWQMFLKKSIRNLR